MQFRNLVKDAAIEYQRSCPGPPNMPSNMIIQSHICSNFKSMLPSTYNSLNSILKAIEYRMELQERASRFAEHLGMKLGSGEEDAMPQCRDIDIYVWLRHNMSSDIEKIREKHKRMDYARREISTKRISGKPNQSQGREFMKPGIWLAAALAGTDWDKEGIDGAVERLVQSVEKDGGKVIGLVDSVMRILGE